MDASRNTVEPAQMAESVAHFSIPALDATGAPERVDSGEIDSQKLMLRGGEVLISRLNPRKSRVYHVPPTLEVQSVASTEFIPLLPHAVDGRYLAYFLQSELTRQTLDGLVRSATRSHQRVEPAEVLSLDVPVGAAPEQRRIADFLDDRIARIDQIIAARDSQGTLLAKRLQSFSRRAITFGTKSTERRESGIEWMPQVGSNHRLWRVSRAFSTGSGTTPATQHKEYYDGSIPWVTTSDLRDGEIVSVPRGVSESALIAHPALRKFPPGTLLVAMYGATVGRTGLLRIAATTNQACCALIPTGPVTAEYAFYWFNSYRPEIMTLASGGGQPNVSQEVVRGLHIPAQDLAAQREVVAVLDDHAASTKTALTALGASITLLQEYKQSLITAAVTGEFDVTTASTKIPEN